MHQNSDISEESEDVLELYCRNMDIDIYKTEFTQQHVIFLLSRVARLQVCDFNCSPPCILLPIIGKQYTAPCAYETGFLGWSKLQKC